MREWLRTAVEREGDGLGKEMGLGGRMDGRGARDWNGMSLSSHKGENSNVRQFHSVTPFTWRI